MLYGSYEVSFHPGFPADFTALYGHFIYAGVACVGLFLLRNTQFWNSWAKIWLMYLTLVTLVLAGAASFFYSSNLDVQMWYVQLLCVGLLVTYTVIGWLKKSTVAIRWGLGAICVANLFAVGSLIPFSTYEVQEHNCGATLRAQAFNTRFRDLSEAVSLARFFRTIEQKYTCSDLTPATPESYGRVYHGPFTITHDDGTVTSGRHFMGVTPTKLIACTVESQVVEF